MSVRQFAIIAGLVFALALAFVVGRRLSAEAMAVVVGVVCGVVAGIPTSVILLMVLSRREGRRLEESSRRTRAGSYPPVVVIQGGTPEALSPGPQAGYWPAPAPSTLTERRFRVVGGEELLDDRPY